VYDFAKTNLHDTEVIKAPHRWGTASSWWWGVWAPRILQIPLFGNPKGRRLLRVPQFGPQNPAYGGAKISGEPVQSMCSQGVLAVPQLVSILRSWHWAPGIKSSWCIYGICAVYSCLAVWEPQQWWCTSGGGRSSYGSSWGPFPQSHPRWARKLWGRLEKYACLSAGSFFQLKYIIIWLPGHNSVPGNVTMFFNHNDGILLHIMGFRSISSFSYLDTLLSSVITLIYSATMMAGYSILGFYPLKVMHSFKFIRLVRVTHWAAIDGWPQRWMVSQTYLSHKVSMNWTVHHNKGIHPLAPSSHQQTTPRQVVNNFHSYQMTALLLAALVGQIRTTSEYIGLHRTKSD